MLGSLCIHRHLQVHLILFSRRKEVLRNVSTFCREAFPQVRPAPDRFYREISQNLCFVRDFDSYC